MTRRRGFTLVEILLALMLFSIFGVIAMRLFAANFQVQRSTLIAENNSAEFDRAVGILRADVAGSASCESPAPDLLRVYLSKTDFVDWRSHSDGLSRTHHSNTQIWTFRRQLTVKMDAPLVLLASPDDPANPLAFAPTKPPIQEDTR
jgi:prepilin-type N-terminal cleavage/methylation domain-containing protein